MRSIGGALLLVGLTQAFPHYFVGAINALLALACCGLACLALRSAKPSNPTTSQILILKEAREVLFGASAEIRTLQLTNLHSWRAYLGLQFLALSDGRAVLIWPDSLSADARRKLRVWLKAQARGRRESLT